MSYKEAMDKIAGFLGSNETLNQKMSEGEKNEYVVPTGTRLGSITLFLLRTSAAPLVIKGEGAEMTEAEVPGLDMPRLCAKPEKFKFGDRQTGLAILRELGLGGKHLQNRTTLNGKNKPSSAFDMNTAIFGDSSFDGKRVLPVKAGASYQDALSLAPAEKCTSSRFGILTTGDEGLLFDYESKQNSNNIRTSEFVKPGVRFLQTITLSGRRITPEMLSHLLASLPYAGSSGGRTSVSGINLNTDFLGACGFKFASRMASTYACVKGIVTAGMEDADDAALESKLKELVSEDILDMAGTTDGLVWLSGEDLASWRREVCLEIASENFGEVRAAYQATAAALADHYDKIF